MKYLSLILLICSTIVMGQAGSAPGRVTGNHGLHGSYNIGGSFTVSCNSTASVPPWCPQSSSTGTAAYQLSGGTITFTTSHDSSGSSSGTGSGGGILFVTCNGGTPIAIAQVTFSGAVVTYSYSGGSCAGVTNLNQIQFYATVVGGGLAGYAESFTSPSQIIATF